MPAWWVAEGRAVKFNVYHYLLLYTIDVKNVIFYLNLYRNTTTNSLWGSQFPGERIWYLPRWKFRTISSQNYDEDGTGNYWKVRWCFIVIIYIVTHSQYLLDIIGTPIKLYTILLYLLIFLLNFCRKQWWHWYLISLKNC